MKTGRYVLAVAAMALVFSLAAAWAAPVSVNVSGYEFLLGTSCTIDGRPGTCGVEFGGWTGGRGPVENGWRPFPGNRQGLWMASVNYTGKAEFGGQVNLENGSFDLLFTSGRTVLGNVTGGKVMWPPAEGTIGCGTDVAMISVNVTFIRGATGTGLFQGCLHDLPAGSVIPPKIWGTLRPR